MLFVKNHYQMVYMIANTAQLVLYWIVERVFQKSKTKCTEQAQGNKRRGPFQFQSHCTVTLVAKTVHKPETGCLQ